MADNIPDHYATLGLGRRCTLSQIRAAYRSLATRFHPDRNQHSADGMEKMQAINEAYETLEDPARRRVYDRDLDDLRRKHNPPRSSRPPALKQDVYLPLRAFIEGTAVDVRINDPSNEGVPEAYRLDVPPETAPGTTFTIPREEAVAGGKLQVRVKPLPNPRFKVRGSDLRCDLKISLDRATRGGTERIAGPMGQMLTVQLGARVSRGDVIRIDRQGLPKARGGRGDLLVRILYRPEVRFSRA